jgi:amidase
MSRSVQDAALLLDALTGTSGYRAACGTLPIGELRLARAEAWLSTHPPTDELFAAMLDTLRGHGATVEDVEIPTSETVGDDELAVLLAELVDGMDAYLAGRPGAGVGTLAEAVAFNERHAAEELAHFGQDLFERALATGGRSGAGYADARARCLEWAVDRCLGPTLLGENAPAAVIAPAYAPAWKCDLVGGDSPRGGGLASAAPSIAGWPVLCLPMGLVGGLPVGLVLIGKPHSEARLLAAGHAVEEALGLREAGLLAPAWTRPARG